MRYHDDPGSCVKIWWGERLSDRCDWPGSWGMDLHYIRLQERYSYFKHSSTPLSSGEATKNGPSVLTTLTSSCWCSGFGEPLKTMSIATGPAAGRSFVSVWISMSKKCQQTPQRAHRRCASSMKVKVPTLSTCITPPKSGNPEIVAFINDASNLR